MDSGQVQRQASGERVNLPHRVGIVIPTTGEHVYRLGGMLACIEAQTVRPAKVVVVHDSPHDSTELANCVSKFTFNVELIRKHVGDGTSGNPARNVGFESVKHLPYVLFLDDDDTIPRDYIERLLAAIERNPRAAASYPRMRFCGNETREWQIDYSPETLARTNVSGTVALIRTDALRQVGGWPILFTDRNGNKPHDDWALWRRFAAYGWQLEPADVQYDYHKHGSGICQSHRSDQFNDWLGAVDSSFNFVTIAIPLSGRGWCVERLLDSILSQSFPLEYCSLLLYDNSCCDNFSNAISDWVGEHMRKFASLLYLQDMRTVNNRRPVDIADGPLDRDGLGGKVYGEDVQHRVGGIWNRIGQLVTTDLVWCVEDDVIPPPYCLERLLQAMNGRTDAVTACYESRVVSGHAVAWDYYDRHTVRHLRPRRGVETIDGCGFGCVVVRKELFQQITARSQGEAVGYDCNFWLDAKRMGYCLKIDWELECEHLMKR